MSIDFMDLANRYASARLDQATRPFTDTEGYMNDRMQQNYGVDIYGNTKPKSTTISYNDDGTQTITNKTEVAPQQQPPSYMPDETAAETQRLLAQNAAAAPQPAPQPEIMPAPVSQPQPMVQPQAMPSAQLPPPLEIGPGVQVAGPMVQPPPPVPDQAAAETQRLLAQNAAAAPVAPVVENRSMAAPAPVSPYAIAPQVAPATGLRAPAPTVAPAAQAPMSIGAEPKAAPTVSTAPHYSDDFRNIYNKPNELAKYMGNDANPEAGRKVAAELLKIQLNGADGEAKANDVLTRMATGDTKATNQVMRDLRQDKAEGSYIKAILFSRLGLNDLAKEEQEKLSTGGKMSRAILGDQTYAVVTNAKGAITKAYDENGDIVNDRTLAKLNASGVTQDTNAYGFTGEAGIITEPDGTKAEVRQRTNNRTGRVENVYVGGPKANQVYTGGQIPQPKSVTTAMAKMDYGVITDLQKKHGGNVLDAMAGYEKIKGPMTPGERQDFMSLYGYNRTVTGGPVTQPEGAQPGVVNKPADPAAVARADADIAAIKREIAATKPTEQNRVGILNNELAIAQQRRQSLGGGAISGLPGGAPGGGVNVSGGIRTPVGALETQQALGKRAGEERIQVAGKRSESFNKILDEEVRPQGQAGDTVSSVRKQQFALFDRPGVDTNKIFGLYNAAAEGTGDQKLSILRDIFGGVFKPETEVSQRLALLNLTPQERSALMEYNTANQKINAATLKQTAGPGSVSDAEQRANREANVDPTKVPALGAFNAMAQSQFDGDRARYKADWALTSPATNALQLDKEWRKENQRLSDMYRTTATERAQFIAANGGTTAAVQQGYKRFPVPEYDAETGTWKKTRPLNSYER